MVLTVDNLTLPLMWTPTGPLLSTQDKYLEPIAWIINPAVTGRIPDFADKLARREEIFMPERYAAPPMPDEDLSEPRARWQELTGSKADEATLPAEDVYVLGTGFTYHQVMLPRQTLLSIFQALLKKRAEFPEPPFPWLFRPKPYYVTPTEGEEELLGELEKRAVALKQPGIAQVAEISRKRKELLRDLENAGLFSEEYSEEKQHWLEVWEYSTLLVYHNEIMKSLKHIRQALFLEPEPVQDMFLSIRAPKYAPHSTTAGQVVYSQFAHA